MQIVHPVSTYYIVFLELLKSVFLNGHGEQISALCVLFKKIKLSMITSYILTLGNSNVWSKSGTVFSDSSTYVTVFPLTQLCLRLFAVTAEET